MKKMKLELSDELVLHLKMMREVLAGVTIGYDSISDPQGCDAICGAVCTKTCSFYCRDSCEVNCRGKCSNFMAKVCELRMIF